MIKGCVEQTAITIRAIQIPILGCGIVMLTLLVFVWGGTLAHANEHPVRVSNSSDMIGKLVKTPDGKNLGKIKDLVINWRSGGYIEYAVLSFGGLFGLGDEYVAVPWEALTLGDNKEHLVLNIKKEHLKNSPGFVVHHFYDRSSVAAQRGGRSTATPSAHVMKGDIGSDVNVSVARSFDMQYALEAEFHR
jgi:sporulation protein YlmC with PRC-barrel domain